jgi:serine/threonine protein kinase
MSLQVALSQGTIIGGHYIVGSLLNSGGFGAIYRGTDTSEGNRSCAIKETYDVTPSARRRALMEASVLLTVRNQHLPEVYDAFEFNGRFYLVMQLIEGQNLLQVLKSRIPPGRILGEAEPNQQSSGPCSEQEVLNWLLPVMDVLQDLHSRNPPILHRDIKPGNLILTPQGRVVLVDFGLTKLYDPARDTQTMTKAVSAGFSPLEQYMGKTSPQSDVYSMAVTMYLLLTNRLPSAAVTRSMSDDLIMPRLLNPCISPKVERALLRALAIHADQRYQSMSEFAQALREPAFTAYSDKTAPMGPPTIQNTQVPVAPTVVGSPSTPPSLPSYTPAPVTNPALPISAPHAYTGVHPMPVSVPPMPNLSKKKGLRPTQQKKQPPQPYPVFPPGGSASGYGVPSQIQGMKQPYGLAQRLPSASRQGRLWGMLLGIGAALIVGFSRQEAGFYLAVLIGFMAYLAAGFFATRRGGNFFRGGSAGYWAGVTSLVMFGTTLGIFLMIAFVQQLHLLRADSDDRGVRIVATAWNAVKPALPSITILPDQPPFINFIAVLVVAVFIAWLLGLIGGIIGSLRNSAYVISQQQQVPHP